jgi:hypothetical protein
MWIKLVELADKYIWVGVLWCVESSEKSFRAFTAEEIAKKVEQKFKVTFTKDEIRRLLDQVYAESDSTDYLEYVSSPFADDRYIIRVNEIPIVARFTGVEALWYSANKIGESWLRETIDNIRKLMDGAEQTTEGVEHKSVPASDRYVTPSDNSEKFGEIEQALSGLKSDVEGSNSIEEEERLIALSEIALFEASIAQPRLALDIIERFLAFCATKLSSWIGGAATALIVGYLKDLLEVFVQTLTT